jgi:energy-coupling factor transporter ATP-binding protein EcfA2
VSDQETALAVLKNELEKRNRKTVLSFVEYLELVRKNPRRLLRNIFQLFYDMVKTYVGEGIDEYPDDPESIGFVKYDCSKLFVEGADTPFLPDRLFANRFVRQVESLKKGAQQNQIHVYYGPSGCGKSTFINNLLRAFEGYTRTEEGRSFEVFWELNESLLRGDGEGEVTTKKLFVPCPSHDYPILLVPKTYRAEFLKNLLPETTDEERAIKHNIFIEKEYEWIFRNEACTICRSIFWSCMERLDSFDQVLSMVKVRPYRFDRRLGQGISVFNPGDKPVGGAGNTFFVESSIQERLDNIFGANAVRYIYSPLAKTNNGIYVLMDVKLHNQERLLELHNVISEGTHKVQEIEEPISSLFIALMNPEDKAIIEEKKMESFRGRMKENKILFVLEPATEVNIWKIVFGRSIEERFLPRVLENFAKVIVASRMKRESPALKEWISDLKKYNRYCDENGLLLRMALYSGTIPDWLSEEDRKKFTAPMRKALIAEGTREGDFGFDGRLSIELFGEFFSRYGQRQSLINMDNVAEFFKHGISREERDKNIPKNFLESLVNSYDYAVLGEVKESLYFYNKEQIQKDILNYLCAVNYEIGDKVICKYTGEEFEVTLDFLKMMASRLLAGKMIADAEVLRYTQELQKRYISIISREGDRNDIIETDFYRDLFGAYTKNLKEKVLEPFVGNQSFREAVKVYGTRDFEVYDGRLKEHVRYMFRNLMDKFGYTEQGAREICLYVLDKELVKKFA